MITGVSVISECLTLLKMCLCIAGHGYFISFARLSYHIASCGVELRILKYSVDAWSCALNEKCMNKEKLEF